MLRQGVLPPRESIRPEEWVNAMPTDLPAPDDELGVTVDSSATPYAEDGTALVRVGVQARELTEEDRRPVHMTFVVDTSGSMDIRNRLGLVQSTLALLVDSLEPTDTVAVVTYSTGSSVLLEPTPVSDGTAIVGAIDELRPHGSTNLAGGLRDGHALAEQAYDPEADNVVVLASDGVANVGVTGPGSLATMVQERAAQDIHLATVGYGMGSYNDHQMEQLADQGDGFYSYVDTFEEAERLFVDDLPELLTIVAEDAKVQVSFDPALVEEYRLVGYANRALDDAAIDDLTADAGELGAGASVTALYELRVAAGVEPGTPVGEVDLRWRSGADDSQRAAVEAVPAPEAVPPEGTAAVAALTGTLAELLRGDSVVAARGVTLGDLATDVAPLAEAGVPGAAELADTVALATEARPQAEPFPVE